MRTVLSKPKVRLSTPSAFYLKLISLKSARRSFLLHVRYNFHNPPLRARDYTAIEHRVRRPFHPFIGSEV